jgi:HAD superfamily hydrolase (TIGR01662 family)
MNRPAPPEAVLFDRDGTLVVDVPHCTDPDLVRPVRAARVALDALRAAGIPIGVVSNQPGIGRGLVPAAAAAAVDRRVTDLLGPFDTWQVCPHTPEEGCACRKPLPGMVMVAAEDLGVPPDRVVVVGDIGTDVEVAHAAGARSVLVPTQATRPEEIHAAPFVCLTLLDAVDYLLAPLAAGR